MTLINNYTIGSDFELFVKDNRADEVINAKKFVKGTKKKPYNFDKSSPFWCTSLDGVSMEGNIKPCTSADDFDRNIQYVIDYMNSTLPEGLCTIHDPAVIMLDKHMKTKEARTFGCEPSFDAYTKYVKEMEVMPEDTNLRTCCTHVHVRYDNMDFDLSCELIKAMDIHLGIPSLLLEPDNQRRLLYGTLGEMRFNPEKTTEYRVLSSFFSSTSALRQWVYKNTIAAINWINNGNIVGEDLGKEMRRIMSGNDKESAKKLVNDFKIILP